MTGEKQRRGFALLTPDRLREISREGGRRRAELGVGHRFTVEEAREAGRKGGMARAARRRQVTP